MSDAPNEQRLTELLRYQAMVRQAEAFGFDFDSVCHIPLDELQAAQDADDSEWEANILNNCPKPVTPEGWRFRPIKAGQVWRGTDLSYGNEWLVLSDRPLRAHKYDGGSSIPDGVCYEVRPLWCHKQGWQGVWRMNERHFVEQIASEADRE